jgi:GNAT superfamily N-acetyltransferase
MDRICIAGETHAGSIRGFRRKYQDLRGHPSDCRHSGQVTTGLEIRAQRYDSSAATRLVAELQLEYVERYGGPDETEVDPHEFDPPHGGFLVVYTSGAPIACGGFRRFDHHAAEVKRMFVRSGWRRQGIAKLLLRELEESIASAGYREIRLMTGREQSEAIQLYANSGYHLSETRFGIYRDEANARFFSKSLGSE